MSYIEMKEWLDRQIAWREEGKRLKEFNSQIYIRGLFLESCILMSEIKVVADMLGVELKEERYEHDVRYSFPYKGYTVVEWVPT